MVDLILHLKGKYFDQIKSGIKLKEYRLANDYWRRRLEGKTYDGVVVVKAYPHLWNKENMMIFTWNRYGVEVINHEEFGILPALVYAILLLGRRK